jgi:hypothetical protein
VKVFWLIKTELAQVAVPGPINKSLKIKPLNKLNIHNISKGVNKNHEDS